MSQNNITTASPGTIIVPTTTITTAGTYTNVSVPYYPTATTSPTITWNIGGPVQNPYYTFKLPKKTIPIKVYYNGKLMSFGIVGSSADYFILNGMLIINRFLEWCRHSALIVEFKKDIYHYAVREPYYDEKNNLNAELLSVIKK